ncbi:Fe-S cluster assembly protein SufD [Rhizobium sp.]
MSVQPLIKPTNAEQALLDAFGQNVGMLPGDAAVTTQRSTLLKGLREIGLPTRRRESWHYTDLRSLLRTVPANQAVAATAVDPVVAGSRVLSVVNGAAQGATGPDGVSIKSYADTLSDGSALKGLSLRDNDDIVGRLNGSFVRDGFVVDVIEGAEIAEVIEIQSVQGGGQHHVRFPARFGKGSKATVIERHVAGSDTPALVSTVSDISVGDEAEITWIILQQQGRDDTHLGQFRVKLGRDAKLTLYVINAGGRLVRQDLYVDVDGTNAELMLRGINLLGGDSHTDVTLVLGHNVEHTTSTETIRNVVFDKAKGVFQGQIRVANAAQKTDAKMACNTLLLSDEADFSVKPELEIFADDVICGHGATVTDIHPTHLFYLKSRGIPEKHARHLLVQAFVQETVEELEDEVLIEALETVIQAWLEKHA